MHIQSELRYLEEAGLPWRRGPEKGAQGCGLDCDQLFATNDLKSKLYLIHLWFRLLVDQSIERKKLPTNVDFVWLCAAISEFEKIGKVCRTHRGALIDRLTDWLKNKKLWPISILFCCSQTSEHEKITDYWLTIDRLKRIESEFVWFWINQWINHSISHCSNDVMCKNKHFAVFFKLLKGSAKPDKVHIRG